ncbi:MAG: segregation/condensation protein A [Clostridia bacterium]|nr:segregation/condensation protein A [Clostridia bacterium]
MSTDEIVTAPAETESAQDEEKRKAEEQKRAEIQKYIDSLEDKDVYNPDSYEIHLDNFDGPLDLLWFLIRRSKIDINEIFVSKITEQYLETMSQIETLDLDRASEFLEVAACLVEIKSKALLPRPPVIEDPEDDPEKTLIRRLEEYRIYKEASAKIKEIETTGQHYRMPDSSVGKPRLVLADMTMDGLVEALKKMFLKLEVKAKANQQRNIKKDRFTVADKFKQIQEYFADAETVNFTELFDDTYTKSEIITTFQAMLELLKVQFFRAEQKEVFGEIILHRVRQVEGENND